MIMRSIPATTKECRHIKKIVILKDCIVLWSYNTIIRTYVYTIWSRDGFEQLDGGCFCTYKKLFEKIKAMRKEHEQ